jgi:hypothetical protein
MPVLKCGNDKWRIGTGPCMYTSKEKADRAYRAYLYYKHGESKVSPKGIPQHVLREANTFVTRYDALGMDLPDPKTICHGQCEGTGVVPIYMRKGDTRQYPVGNSKVMGEDETDPRFISLWQFAEDEEPSEGGWHFVTCPDCGGTGKRPSENHSDRTEEAVAAFWQDPKDDTSQAVNGQLAALGLADVVKVNDIRPHVDGDVEIKFHHQELGDVTAVFGTDQSGVYAVVKGQNSTHAVNLGSYDIPTVDTPMGRHIQMSPAKWMSRSVFNAIFNTGDAKQGIPWGKRSMRLPIVTRGGSSLSSRQRGSMAKLSR